MTLTDFDKNLFMGNLYGNLQIVDVRSEDNADDDFWVIWKCIKCGDMGWCMLSDLARNYNRRCWCSSETRKRDHANFIGRFFHALRITDVIRHYKSKPIALCNCKCGKIVFKDLWNVVYGHIHNCGLDHELWEYKYQYLNKRFGNITIIDLYFKTDKWHTNVITATYVCDCGTVKEARLYDILNSPIVSCGCQRGIKLSTFNMNHRKGNEFHFISDSLVEVIISNDSSKKMLVDAITWNYLKRFTWRVDNRDYCITCIENRPLAYHRIILDCPVEDGFVRDHIDRNPLNNTYSNLRVVDFRGNVINRAMQCNNTSGYVGVHHNINHSQNINGKSWEAYTSIYKDRISKFFSTQEEAIEYRFSLEKDYLQINELQTEHLILDNGQINWNYPFSKYDYNWDEILKEYYNSITDPESARFVDDYYSNLDQKYKESQEEK